MIPLRPLKPRPKPRRPVKKKEKPPITAEQALRRVTRYMSQVAEDVNRLEIEIYELRICLSDLKEDLKELQIFMSGTQVHICKEMQDLHSRLNYIKSFVGVDEFFKNLRGQEATGGKLK
jgi:hypothetical protein